MNDIIQQVGTLLLGAVPTVLLFIALVLAYQFLIQGPLTRTLAERRARTSGAVEEAHKAIARAEQRAAEYADKLRQARAEIFKTREQRIQQWSAERDAAVNETRKSAGAKVAEAKAAIDAEAETARQAIHSSAGELAGQVVRAILPQAAGGVR
jgi:F-type H+-transporting ATPase subunit b